MQKIRETTIRETDLMVSFDVKNLFTREPVKEALGVIKEDLTKDESLEGRTLMSQSIIMHMSSH